MTRKVAAALGLLIVGLFTLVVALFGPSVVAGGRPPRSRRI